MALFEAQFKRPTLLQTSAELQRVFGTDTVALAPGAELAVRGRLSLGREVTLYGRCRLDDGTSVEQGSILTDVDLGSQNCVRPYSILTRVRAGDRNLFGPFCFIRDDCTVGNDCILGAHVEAARSCFGSGVKISHRAFVGDAEVRDAVIIGAGVVFCNWDGRERRATIIKQGALIGSGTLLIPPLTVGARAVLGAGSTVTRDVADGTRIIQRRPFPDALG